jgi:hypothetical protein
MKKSARFFWTGCSAWRGKNTVLEGRYFAARNDIKFSVWEKEGVEMAKHAQKALGVDSFWDLNVGFH